MSEILQINRIQEKAYLMINCESGCESQVLDEIRTFPQIKEAILTIGRHDIFTLIETSSFHELKQVIEDLRKIPEIYCTTTLVCATI